MKMKKFLALVLALALALSLVACGGTGGKDVDSDTTFNTLYASEVTTLNYLITTQENEMSIAANVVDCLIEYDAYGNIEPALALSWEPNDDATVWTFKLREGVKWVDKDGNEKGEVTAEDFVNSAHYVCDANNAAAGASNLTGVVAGAKAYYNWTAYQIALANAKDGKDENGNPCKIIVNEDGEEEVLEPVAEAKLEDIGVKAIDKYTLEYTLSSSRPYFLSMVSFGAYMPTSAALMAEVGDKFGTSNEYLWYCGAYILSDYQPQNQRVMTKNSTYWDIESVYIEKIEQKYNAEASSVSTTMYASGDVDSASVSSDLLTTMMEDDAYKNEIHPTRADTSYSYWYLFNFDPQFDAEYEPENWKKAVNNENFRHAVIAAFDRVPALATQDALDPASLVSNTITPAGFASASKDFTAYGDMAKFAEGKYYDEKAAADYKDKAMTELKAAGATFPIKMLMCYNPTSSNWANECQVVEQKIESVLGKDFIDIIVEAGPDTGFLGAVRRSGKYAFMKCNWGADYADPETWTDPFTYYEDGSDKGTNQSTYSFIYASEDANTQKLYKEYMDLVDAAKAITTDMEARYEAFAKAEALLLEHAFALPIHTSSRSYQMSKLSPFESQYAPFGIAYLRYKDQHLYNDSMNVEEFNEAYSEWLSKLG